uniref:Transporter n=1 Tax=Meloidogyne javanica TaxID=6303 RepID=A0A915MSP0_MELJA
MAKKWFSRARQSHELVPSSEELQQQQSLQPIENKTLREGTQKSDANGDDALLHDSHPQKGKRKLSVLGHELFDRGQWSGQFDFLMSMIAYAVGLGNVWRFPYLCFKNGGGSFLVVYALFFVFGAVPIFIMEVTVGQYLQRGVGIGNVVIAFMCIAYFCVIVSWATFYMISSFNSTFPWETCNNYWNNGQCVTGKESTSEIMRITSNLSRYVSSVVIVALSYYLYKKICEAKEPLEQIAKCLHSSILPFYFAYTPIVVYVVIAFQYGHKLDEVGFSSNLTEFSTEFSTDTF